MCFAMTEPRITKFSVEVVIVDGEKAHFPLVSDTNDNNILLHVATADGVHVAPMQK